MKHTATLPRTYTHTYTEDSLESFNRYIERKTRMELWFIRIFYLLALMALIAEVYFIIHFGAKAINWLLK